MASHELLSGVCGNCKLPFAAVRPSARFCSERCRVEKWNEDRKRCATVDALMKFFDISISEKQKISQIVDRHSKRFYQFLTWLGFQYRTKRYIWEFCDRVRIAL